MLSGSTNLDLDVSGSVTLVEECDVDDKVVLSVESAAETAVVSHGDVRWSRPKTEEGLSTIRVHAGQLMAEGLPRKRRYLQSWMH